MKRGKTFFLYVSSVVFCFLFFVFTSNKVSALDDSAYTFVCIDKSTESVCNGMPEEAYYILSNINIGNESISELVVPQTHVSEHGEFSVEKIGSNVITSSNLLNLTKLTLPDTIVDIADNAFSGITSVEEFVIPRNTKTIGSNIFSAGTVIDNMYLNHYIFDFDTYLVFKDDSLADITINKIICNNYATYTHFSNSIISNQNLVMKVEYIFYTYENKELLDVKETRTYYAGSNSLYNEVPEGINVKGLNFDGWYIDGFKENAEVVVDKKVQYVSGGVYEYKVYPKYSIKDMSFSVSATNSDNQVIRDGTTTQYSGEDNLVNLKVSNITHELSAEEGLIYTVEWKSSIDEVLNTTSEMHLSEVNESGDYKCVITYSYTYMGIEYKDSVIATKSIVITKAPLYLIVENVTKTYGEYLTNADIKFTSNGLLNGDVIESVTYTYLDTVANGVVEKKEKEVGVYENEIGVIATSIVGNGKERLSNYSIICSYGDFIVNPKYIEVYYDTNLELYYGDNIEIKRTYHDEVYGGIVNTIDVYFAKNTGKNVGEYRINGVTSVSNKNYLVSYNSNLTTGKVIIKPKKVNSYMEIDDNTYNGQAKNVRVYYNDVNSVQIELGYRIEYINEDMNEPVSVNKIINAGDYTLYVDDISDSNYVYYTSLNKEFDIRINKATPIVTYPSKNQSFAYSGEKIDPNASINNNEQTLRFECTSTSSTSELCIKQATYTVKIKFNKSINYIGYDELPKEKQDEYKIFLTITKYSININPKTFTIYYGDEVEDKVQEEYIINGEKVILKYDTYATKGSPVDSYGIYRVHVLNEAGGIHNNYDADVDEVECANKVNIVKRPVDVVYFNYENLVYNGKVRQVGAYLIDKVTRESINIKDLDYFETICDEVEIKDAKTYHMRAYLEDTRYYIENTNLLVFSIAKATYDISNIRFNSKEFTWDFKEHSIGIEGSLPEGVTVSYTIDGEEGNSTSKALSHTVVAKFIIDELNYHAIDNMEATIYLDMSWVFIAFTVTILVIGIAICGAILYVRYRRAHPRKIKLKIKSVVKEDLAAKRAAKSIKEVLGDEEVEQEEVVEDENDLLDNIAGPKSFIDRIYAANSEVKYYYSEVKNELLSYKGVTHTVDRKYEVFNHGTRQIAKLSICNGVLRLYVNLDPTKYDVSQYNHKNMSKFDCHAKTPLRLDVNTTESLRHARVFISILRKKENLKAVSNFVKIDYEKFYTLKENVLPKIFKKMFKGKKEKKKK